MQFGINTFLWTANFGPRQFELLPEIKQHGFDGVEVSLIYQEEFQAAAIRRATQQAGLACTVCAVLPRELNLLADDAAIRKQTITHLAQCIRLTAEAGASVIAGPLYAPVGYLPGRRRTPEEWRRAVEGYAQLGAVLRECEVDLCLEPLNRFETYFLNTTADAVALCKEVDHPRVGILWDSFHANIEEKSLGASLRLASPYLKHVHACENDRGIPGSGHIEWPNIFSTLYEVGYDRWCTIESFGFSSGQLAAAASIWRDLADSPEQIAWEGLAFLQNQWANRAAIGTHQE